MTPLPPLRPTETGSADVEPAAVLRGSSPVRTAAAVAAAAAVFLAVVLVAGVGRVDGGVPGFLADALGPEKAEAPMERTPAVGVDVRIHDRGYSVSHRGMAVSVASEDVGGATWRRHVHGVTRETDFGTETIVVDGRKTEAFLTVAKRQGKRTWGWRLASRLEPRLARDGAVTFLDPTRHLVTSITIDPVRILDAEGNDVTPTGLRWGLEEGDAGWLLTLTLDDRDLSLPYVIDPAVTHRAAQTASTAASTSLSVTVPAGVEANDLLVAHIARLGNAAINTPSGWTASGGTNNGSFLRQASFYRVADGSEPASYTWTWTGTQPAAGGMSAYYGVKASSPLDVIGTAATGNNTTTVTAPSITTGGNDALVVAFFSSNTNSAYSTATGMSERYEAATSGAASIGSDDMPQVSAGATGNKTSTATASGRVVGHQVSFNVDDVAPTGSLTDPGSTLAGTILLAASADDTDSAVASVLFQRSPADAGTWTDIGTADTTSPYSVSFDTTAVADGLYDLRAVVTDLAGTVANSTVVEDRRVDNTAPTSNTDFPESSGSYNAATWDSGCGTSGLCGTYSDDGSGVSQVEISIRQGSGNYWSAGSFSSPSEVWNATTLAGGTWSYGFAAASFPAPGGYTVRIRSVDVAGNVESPSARTFTIDVNEPETTIDSTPADPTASTSASFAFSADEGGSSFECRIDGGSWSACTSPRNYTSLTDGSHTFEVRATDFAGNTDASPASFTWMVDATAPSSTTAFPAAGGEYSTTGWATGCVTNGLCGTYSDAGGSGVAQVEVSIRQGSGNYWDGAAFTSATETWNDATLAAGDWSYAFDSSDFPADGSYTVRVRATDAVVNAEAPSSGTFAYDTTSPSALFTLPAAGGHYTNATWNAGCPTSGFCGTHSDSLSGVAAVEVSIQRAATGLYWDGSSFASTGEAFETATLAGGDWSVDFAAAGFPADGQYTVHVRAIDDAGNAEPGPSRMFRIDNAAPSSTVSFPAPSATYHAAGWNAGCPTSGFCGTHSDGGSGVQSVEVSIRQGSGDYWDGANFSSGTEVWNTATLAGGDWSLDFAAAGFPADGGYTVRVRATDVAGNVETPASRSFTIDRAAPQTTIDSLPSDPTSSTSADFDFSADEGGSSFECRLDGGGWSACTTPRNYTSLTDGSHTFDVRATDTAGNTDASPASYTWLVDTTAPSSTTAFPAAGGEYNTAGWNAGCTTNGLCGTYSDAGGSGVAQVEVSIRQGSGSYWDGAAFTSATETWNDATLAAGDWSYAFDSTDFPADGSYTIRVRARDDAGNTETASSRTFTHDSTEPATLIDSSMADPTNSTSASFDFSSDEAGSTFECALDGGAWSACTSPKAYVDLPDGSHSFEVRATDPAGNTDGNPASFSWTIDTVSPSSSASFPSASGSYTAAAWDAGCSTSGLCGSYSDTGVGVVDVEVSIRQGSGDYWDGSGFTSGTEVWNDATLAAGDWSFAFDSTDFPADGDYTVRLRARDDAGNVESASARTFTYDTTAPQTDIDSSPADPTASTSADFDFSSNEGGSTFECRLDGGAWSACTSPESYTGLGDGDHTFEVRATDAAGNTDASPASYTWLVDTSAPSSTIDFPAVGGEYNAAGWNAGCALAGICGTYTDGSGSGVDQVQVSVHRVSTGLYWNGAAFSSATEVLLNTSLAAGDWARTFPVSNFPADDDYTIRVFATDAVGNGEAPASRTFSFDDTNPGGSLTAPADGAAVRGSSVTVSSDSADAGSGVDSAEFQHRPAGGGAWTTIDTDTTTPYSVNWDTTPLADGDYDLRAITTDEAGNTFTSAVRTVTVDNTAPSVTLTAPTGFVNAAAPDPFTVTATTPDGDVQNVELFSCSNASAGCSSGSWLSLGVDAGAPYSASWAVDPDGNRALRAVATDAAWNTGGDVVDVTIDRTSPSGSLTAPADGAFLAGTVAVSSNSADAGSGVDSAEFQRRPAGGGTWTTIDTDTTTPYSVNWDTTPLTDGDYDLRAITTDEAGNTFTSTVRTVTVDSSTPSAPVVTLSESSPFAHVSGSEIFVKTDETGSYDAEAVTSDPDSGIDKVRFPGPTDDFSSPYSATYGFGDLSGPHTVTAFNRAGLTASTPFTVTLDTAEPTGGSVDYPDGYDADGDVTVSVDAGTDALSGVAPASAVLERRTAALSDGSCDSFAGGWSPVTSPDTVGSGLCAQYRYRVSDRVGNETTYTSANVARVDLVSPGAPLLTLVESSPFAHVVGAEIFVNTNEAGSYDVEASTSDSVSGIAKVVFPGGIEDTSAPYASTYDFDDLLGTETVTAHDGAGNTSSSDFDVTEDIAAPSTSDDTASIGSGWQTAPVTVTLTPTDARSGVAATYYTTDGSVPTTSSDEGTSVDLTADGVYVIRYFSVDNVGNVEPVRTAFATIRIDQTNPSQPAITLDESSPYAHVSGTEIFVNTNETGSYDVSATTSDAGSGIDRVAFPGGIDDDTSPYSATYDLDDLSGAQTVAAHDVAGNTASDTFTVTPDTTAPAGGSVDYPDGYDGDGDVTVTVDAGTDALSGIAPGSAVLERQTSTLAGGACDPFAGGWSAVTSPDTVPDSTCARYRYRVSDRVGNEATYTSANVVKVDLTAPQTTIDVAPGDPSSDPSPAFEFSASEGGATFACRLDGGAWSACSSPETVGPLVDGSYTFEVRATNTAGLTDPTPASHAWTVDTVAPDTTFDDVPSDPSNDDAPTFEFSADEAGSTFECRLDGGVWTACPSPETIGLLPDGSHTFEVRAVDGAGNVDPSPASYTWTVDTVAPDSSFSVVPGDPTNDTSPTFEFSADEGGSTFECRLDGGAWSACSSPETRGPLADGSHTFEVRATDPAGNQETAPASYTWTADAGAPPVTITQPGGFVNAADADPYTVRATSPDGDVAEVEFFRCSDASTACATGSWVSLGTDATAPYEASWPLDADGNRALRALATDTASNTGADVVDVTIDRTVPATTIDSAPSDPSGSSSASFEFSASEGGVTFECRLDAGAWGGCSSPHSYAGLTEGSHTFHVRATDAAGNVDPTPATFSWAVDTVAPETTIDVAPGDPSGSPAPSFEFSSSEGGSTFECRLDGGAWSACSSPQSDAGLADGSHTFQVRATDAAGNVDPTPAAHVWTIDATPPGGGLADPGQFLRGTVALTASPSDDGAGVQSVDFQVSPADAGSWTSIGVDTTDPYGTGWDTTAVADGAYDLRIVVTDNAGNSSPSAVVEDRVVDNTAPGATMDDPGAHLRGTVSLTADASDAGSGVDTVSFERSPAGAGDWTTVATSWDTTGVADGLYDLRVTVTDNAGNSTTSAPVTDRRVDNTRPSLTASTPADGVTIASASSLEVVASEDVAGIVGAEIDGAPAPSPSISGDTVTYTHSFSPGPHLLAGELEDLAGNRQPIRIHFTTWTGATADYPYVEKNSYPGSSMSLRSASDTTTVTVPAGAWTGAPTGDWLVVRIDPQPGTGGTGGLQPASENLDVTAYWALDGSAVTSFSLPLEIVVDNDQPHVVPAVFEGGAWRPLAEVPGSGLPAAWADGFAFEGTNVRILTRHLSLFTLLEDAEPPTKPGAFKGIVKKGKFSLTWTAATDNSGLISAYRVYANGTLVKTVEGSKRSVGMGAFKLTDRRAFRVAAEDGAGNVGPQTVALKVVPKLARLPLAAAKAALKKRGFKTGKIIWMTSATVPAGRVVKGAVGGLRPAGSKVALRVSKGRAAARTVAPPTPPPSSLTATPPASSPPAPTPAAPTPAPGTTTTPTESLGEPVEPKRGRVFPFATRSVDSFSEVRRELGFGLLAAAFSIALVAGLRTRRPAEAAPAPQGDQLLLWDERIVRAIRRFLRLS